MYDLLNSFSQLFNDPLTKLAYGTEGVPLLSALILGLLGSVSPCQLTGNIGAFALYGNRTLQKRVPWAEIVFFLLGKIVVFTGLGIVVWIVGKDLSTQLTLYFPWIRKLLGPIFILIGLFLMGIIKIKWPGVNRRGNQPKIFKGKMGSFLLGFTYSLGFCPTMFILFFITLMPMVVSSPIGVVLPSVFAIGTSLPFLFLIFLIWYYGAQGAILKASRKIGERLQLAAGILILVIGVFDTMTYWTF
jgi:cytochrome c-type biogenesis protein